MSARSIMIGLALSTAVLGSANANAASKEQVLTFFQSVACSQLPTGVCEALNADNAKNMLRTYRALLSQRFCGTSNFNAAGQMLAADMADDPDKCRKLLSAIKSAPLADTRRQRGSMFDGMGDEAGRRMADEAGRAADGAYRDSGIDSLAARRARSLREQQRIHSAAANRIGQHALGAAQANTATMNRAIRERNARIAARNARIRRSNAQRRDDGPGISNESIPEDEYAHEIIELPADPISR